ncbi:AraC family transcriptional regulator [Cupriavidus basilensis OR16]|uniref:AraC family transcriptional regulator n=1 Tax=Cupriavidus basilensis OR16 TaxID=1127483 RepID=H1S806_9BURK|nr:AraC family transcriptional regulator [Cupriavidus basilensis OR16]
MKPLSRSASLTNYAAMAQAAGLDPLAMLREVGIDPACLKDPDLKVPSEAIGQLLERSAERSGWEDFGVRLAESRPFLVLGPLAFLVREQSNVRASLQMLSSYIHLHTESLQLWLEEDARQARLCFEYVGRHSSTRQSLDQSITVVYRFLKQALPEGWEPDRVCFMHEAPRDLRVIRRVFSNRASFKEAINGIVLKRADLERPLSTSSQLGRYAHDYVQTLSMGTPRSTTAQVRRLILAALGTGHCSQVTIAAQLGMDVRTIRRHLDREATSFNALMREVRRELAPRYLAGPPRSRYELAMLLGFSAPQSFTRWFRGEFGVPVASWMLDEADVSSGGSHAIHDVRGRSFR